MVVFTLNYGEEDFFKAGTTAAHFVWEISANSILVFLVSLLHVMEMYVPVCYTSLPCLLWLKELYQT